MARTFKEWDEFFQELRHNTELNILSHAENTVNSKQVEHLDKMIKDADFIHFRMDLNLSNTLVNNTRYNQEKLSKEISEILFLYGIINPDSLLNNPSSPFKKFINLQVKRMVLMIVLRSFYENKYDITI
jgi:hypothetical protein